jgi:hypothetical protein
MSKEKKSLWDHFKKVSPSQESLDLASKKPIVQQKIYYKEKGSEKYSLKHGGIKNGPRSVKAYEALKQKIDLSPRPSGEHESVYITTKPLEDGREVVDYVSIYKAGKGTPQKRVLRPLSKKETAKIYELLSQGEYDLVSELYGANFLSEDVKLNVSSFEKQSQGLSTSEVLDAIAPSGE